MPKKIEQISYTTKRSARAKNMRITIKSGGETVLTLPKRVPEFIGNLFIRKNIDWIKRQQKKLATQNLEVLSDYTSDFRSGDKLCFFDQNFYTIEEVKTNKKRQFYSEAGDNLILYVNTKTRGQERRGLVTDFYRDKAHQYLTERSVYFAEALGVSFNQIRIKNTKSRWGSCSAKKNLNYNWRIMLAPKKVIDYLVVHEVCHLKQMNHSPKFWSLVEQLDPDFKVHKKWLKDNQTRLLGFLT